VDKNAPKANTTARVVGGIAGGLSFLGLITLAFMLHMRKRRKGFPYDNGSQDDAFHEGGRASQSLDGLDPFIIPPSYTPPEAEVTLRSDHMEPVIIPTKRKDDSPSLESDIPNGVAGSSSRSAPDDLWSEVGRLRKELQITRRLVLQFGNIKDSNSVARSILRILSPNFKFTI